MTHISTEVLARYLRGELDADSESQVDGHLAECDGCCSLMGRLASGASDIRLPAADAAAHIPAAEEPPPEVPGYEVRGEVGTGGMGLVLAVSDPALKRDLALKTIQARFADNPLARARFLEEAHVAGQLQHPGLAPVHELGELPDGRPYFVMKLVRGHDLAHVLAERADPSEGRPGLVRAFEQVCEAVGYAHSRRVIHRDLKPANVMVGEFGEVQVMDWGLAKVLAGTGEPGDTTTEVETPRESDPTFKTEAALGTFPYMAPEQARGRIDLVDRRSDVFGLGAILCEILTGLPPYTGASRAEVREKAMLARLGPALERIGRSGADAELIKLCKACLAEGLADRPDDAAAVAAGVAAHRAAAEDRARRAEVERGRRRAVTWAAGAVTAVLLLGVIGTTWGLVRANAAAEKERAAQTLTRQRLGQIDSFNDALFGALTDADPRGVGMANRPPEAALANRLVALGRRLDRTAISDPLIWAKVNNRLGLTLANLGRAAGAIPFLKAAVETHAAELGEKHPTNLSYKFNLGEAYREAGQLPKAVETIQETLTTRKAVLEPGHPDILASVNSLATAYHAAGRIDEALPLYKEVLRLRKDALGGRHPDTIISLGNLAVGLSDAGRPREALPFFKEAYRLAKQHLGPTHPDTGIALGNLAGGYDDLGRPDGALPLYRQAYELARGRLGPEHPTTLTAQGNLAGALADAGERKTALSMRRDVFRAAEAKLGSRHPVTLNAMYNLAEGYRRAGRLDEATGLLLKHNALRKSVSGPQHPDTLRGINSLAAALLGKGEAGRAARLFERTLELRRTVLGPNHPVTLTTMANLAAARYKSGDVQGSVTLLGEVCRLSEAALGEDHPDTAERQKALAAARAAAARLKPESP